LGAQLVARALGSRIYQWHSETFGLSRHSVKLAVSDACPNQAFRYKNNIYGIQFHLEVTQEMVNSWKEAYSGELRESGTVIPSFIPDPHIPGISRELFSRFLQLPRGIQ
jgi:hypothetical protein